MVSVQAFYSDDPTSNIDQASLQFLIESPKQLVPTYITNG